MRDKPGCDCGVCQFAFERGEPAPHQPPPPTPEPAKVVEVRVRRRGRPPGPVDDTIRIIDERCGRCELRGHTTEDCDLGTIDDFAARRHGVDVL